MAAEEGERDWRWKVDGRKNGGGGVRKSSGD